jgi:hypothetical protein
LGTILSSDKTTITAMTGNRTAHPLLISLANLDADFRAKSSNRAFVLLALLPVTKFTCKDKKLHGVLQNRLTHSCLDFILKPLKTAASIGVMMADPLGNLRYCFTTLAAYIVDTPEAQMLAGVGGKSSPITLAAHKQFGDPFQHEPRVASTTLAQLDSIVETCDPWTDLSDYVREAKRSRLNGVHEPFWRDWPLADPSSFLTPEPLHHWHRQFWDHDVKWCIRVLGCDELDFRFSILQPHTGYRHFKEGISKLKQVTGRDHQDIQRYIIGIIADAAPKDFIIAIRALLDFRYLAQAPVVDQRVCDMIQASLQEFHDHKAIILDLEARVGKGNRPIDHWQIPKLELMQSVVPLIRANGAPIQWSADITEHAHITEIKDPARASNNQNYDSQICRHLDRTEKSRRFDLATSIREARVSLQVGSHVDDMNDEDDDHNRDLEIRHIETTADLVSSIRPVSNILATRRLSSNYFEEAEMLRLGEDPNAPYPFRTFSVTSTAFHLTRDPAYKQMTVDEAAVMFGLPDLRLALTGFFYRLTKQQDFTMTIGSRRTVPAGYTLPFTKLQVWSWVRIQCRAYHPPHNVLPPETLNAYPPSKEWPTGRYDSVVVHTDLDYSWPSNGLKGKHDVLWV